MRLKSPRRTTTRPTTDLVRGALFSMLASLGAKFDRVLDLFAGTGALGIEALSRGAASVDFVEQNRRACLLVKDNLAQIDMADASHVHRSTANRAQDNRSQAPQSGVPPASHVYCTSANKALQFLVGPYDLVVMDPPYAVTEQQLANLSPGRLLSPGGFLVVLHSSRLTLALPDAGLRLVKQRKHGDTSLSIFQKEGTA